MHVKKYMQGCIKARFGGLFCFGISNVKFNYIKQFFNNKLSYLEKCQEYFVTLHKM